MTTLLIKKGEFLIVHNSNELSEKKYNLGWFTVSQLSYNKCKQIEDIEKYSRLWDNVKKNNCKYSSSIMDNIDDMSKNVYSKSVDFNHNK